MIKRIVIVVFFLLALIVGMFLACETPPTLPKDARVLPQADHDFEPGEMQDYHISQGSHFSLPRIFKRRIRPEQVSWLIEFGENCDYNLGGEDQKDWNKLLGLFFNFFNTRDNTVMVGWRWNPDTKRMELNAYYHVDGSREFTKPLLDVGLNDPFTVDILVDYQEKSYTVVLERSSDLKKVSDSKSFAHNNSDCLEINTYFGGNMEAPQDMTIRKAYLDY